jgi:hypothetical protein
MKKIIVVQGILIGAVAAIMTVTALMSVSPGTPNFVGY